MDDAPTGKHVETRYRGNGSLVAWIAIGATLFLTLLSWVYIGGILSAQVSQNTKALDNLPSIIVPRREVEAKLEGIVNQVETVDEKIEELKIQSTKQVEELKLQSTRQTDQILRRLDSLNATRGASPR